MPGKRILIADDHTIIRSGIKFVIKDILPFAVIDEACNGREVISSIWENEHDLVILDINMPDTDPVALVSQLVACKKRILIFSVNPDELYARKFLKLGVMGYLNKQSGPAEVKKAIRDVMQGIKYISQQVKELDLHYPKSKGTDDPFEILSEKEMLIAKYYLDGYSHTEIKKMLKLHSSTIGTLKDRMFGKLRIKSLVDLTTLARLYRPDMTD